MARAQHRTRVPSLPEWRAASAAFVLSVFLTWTLRSQAQIVNVEPLFRQPTDKPYALTAEGSVNGSRGNTDLFVLGFSTSGRVRRGAHEGLLSGLHERASALDVLVGNRTLGHLRYRYYLTEALQMEGYGQISEDPFRLMQHRVVVGAGPRFVPVRAEPLTWIVALSHMYEVERLRSSADFDDGLTRKRHRLNVMSSARLEFERLTIVQTIYAQPAWADPTNIRVLHILSIQAAVSRFVSLTWNYEQALDTIAPSDVRPLDVRFRGGLKLDL